MPKPVCSKCDGTESMLWRPMTAEGSGYICNECFHADKDKEKPASGDHHDDADAKDDAEMHGSEDEARAKKGAGTRSSSRHKTQPRPAQKGRGRRSFFKQRLPNRAPTAQATVVTSDNVYHKGSYRQIGDIVSMIDIEGGVYYAQIRGFMTDQYCEKSAVITWLLPTTASPPPEEGFDPATYVIGPEEDLPRKLDCMEFVMHAPSEYYKSDVNPYPPLEIDSVSNAHTGYIWTTAERVSR